jgi:di/tricarboxylate transporter
MALLSADARPSPPTVAPETPAVAGLGWRPAAAVFAALALGAALWFGAGLLGRPATIALAVFGAALIGWVVLDLDETPVALASALALVALGVVPATALNAALGNDIVWLLLGGFLLAAALTSSGLAERFTLALLGGTRSVQALMARVGLGVALTAFVIPSTSARAALLLPVFVVLARAIAQPAVTRALALLFVSVILLSAGASLLGAGAHLIAIDFLRRLGLPVPGYGGWIALAAPFALGSCVVAWFVIGRLFLTGEQRRAVVSLARPPATPLTRQQRALVACTLLAVAGFAIGGALGIEPALVSLSAGLLACQPRLTGIDLKTALRAVEWNLLLFMAGSLVLGQALLDSGAAAALGRALVAAWPQAVAQPLLALGLAVGIALLSHLVITSRSARALVLVPVVALPLAAGDANPAVLVLVVVLGSGFCQTLVVSAKPVLLYARAEDQSFSSHDLLVLALALLVPVAALLAVSVLAWWPLLGWRL